MAYSLVERLGKDGVLRAWCGQRFLLSLKDLSKRAAVGVGVEERLLFVHGLALAHHAAHLDEGSPGEQTANSQSQTPCGQRPEQLALQVVESKIVFELILNGDKVFILSHQFAAGLGYGPCVFAHHKNAWQDVLALIWPARENVEGKTDERYFSETATVFGMALPFDFCWIGHVNDNGKEDNSGDTGLRRAATHYKANNPPMKIVVQYDCDKPHQLEQLGNLIVRSVESYPNVKNCKKGTENALVLDVIDEAKWDGFFERKENDKGYGKSNIEYELRKMDLCNYICSLPDEVKRHVFTNLKTEIETLIGLLR